MLTAYASSAETMILWRALMGVAGATLMPATLALIRNIFPDPRERSLAIGIWGAMTAAGAAVGPLVGGFLLEHFWWGSVFLINLPVMAVLVLVGIKLLPESKNPAPGPWDLPSVGLSMIGIDRRRLRGQGGGGLRLPLGHRGRRRVGLAALTAFVGASCACPTRCWTCGCSGTGVSPAPSWPTC